MARAHVQFEVPGTSPPPCSPGRWRHDEARILWPCAGARMKPPILLTGMHRSGGSWVAKMIEGGGGVVHVNEPFNRRHPPGLTPGILHVPPPLAYQHVGPHNEADHLDGFRNMCALRYDLIAELRTNHGLYDLAKTA